ncbi:MAG: hypothetical protein OEY50_06250, partial [Nitrospinota bacterium]|nr:hypothetical protein [Nitrospinota bacterium]
MNEQPQPQFAPMKGDRAAQKKVFTINSISGEEGMALFELMKCWRRKKPWRLEKDADSEKLW